MPGTPLQSLTDTPAATTALDIDALDAYVESQMQTARIPGLAVGVIKNGEVVAMRGYGRADPSGRPVTPQTPFNIGSNTKSFTALAIMQLAEAGRLELDAPVQRYIPWFRMADADSSARITVRHLLNQTSGISNADGLLGMTWTGTESGSLERYVRVLADRPLNRPVGQSYEYSNANYVVLGLIVEAVSGQTYEDYVQQHIFIPLEMRNSFTAQEPAMRNGMAVGYRSWFGLPVPAYLPDDRAVVSAGMLIASVEDMTHYLVAQMNEGRYGGASVISPAGMAEMHRPATPMRGTTPGMPSLSYAMGWAVEHRDGTTILQHDGAWLNYFQSMKLVPEERTAVVVNSNVVSLLDTFTGAPAADHIATGVLAMARQQPPPDGGPRIAQLTLFENAIVVLATGLFLAWLACMPRWYQRVARRGIFGRRELARRSALTLGLHGVPPAVLAYLFATVPGLRVSALMQPDLAAWLAGLAAATVLKGTTELVLLWRVFRRSDARAVTRLSRGMRH